MAVTDVYSRTHELDGQALEAIVSRLEYRARQPLFVRILDEYLDRIEPATLGTVLDMGCGTGFVARHLARRPDFRGRVTGVDLSPHLVAAAERLSRDEGVADRTEYRAATRAHSTFPMQASTPCCRTPWSAMWRIRWR